MGVNKEPSASMRRAVWGMLHADDAGFVSISAEGLTAIPSSTQANTTLRHEFQR